MRARIYQPTKTAMQSGRARTRQWLLEYYPTTQFVEPLMGWTGVEGTQGQVRLRFPSKEAAIAYAKKHGIPYDIEAAQQRRFHIKAYADNFAYDRAE
ncbi:MAG TPA: ETC complex I subunit [Phycisphaerales bacterium]|nr:ETC complex I subunit [Phycisphaerales bacterium]